MFPDWLGEGYVSEIVSRGFKHASLETLVMKLAFTPPSFR